ncbi:hypothetical protein QF046_002499 [Microbacterium sp. W4I4]|uniref:hypothetical protein n=1 Tax=Microbacterium sp. W4I4 TaxID=3042295 RepID=UPI00277D8E99|nr:hypothetical protein [Microbacterium sp. W4I4]MDQ0614858.1 hypothetical protein [Microbacterium sp. W4I4]
MKTTIDLPDDLAAEAKAAAAERRTTLREMMITGLRAELDRRESLGPVDFCFPTVNGNGLAVELDPAQVITRSYGLPDA